MKYSVSDWRSKIGKKPDMRTSVVTALDRLKAVMDSRNEKSSSFSAQNMSMEEPTLTDEEKRARISQLIAKSKKTNLLTVHGSHNPPIAGVLSGRQWNKFVEEAWSKREGTVIHAIILPEGKNPKEVSFSGARIKSSEIKEVDDSSKIPETVTAPAETFEAFVETDCIPPNRLIPNHFLVANTRPLVLKKKTLVEEKEQAHDKFTNSEWYREAMKYTSAASQ